VLVTVLVNFALPAAFLYFLRWLDLYGSERPRIVLACVAWGMVAFLLSFGGNRLTMYVLDVPRSWIGTHTAPIVEEIFKSLILIFLVRRAKLTYFVDGAIYGFASGMGFAIIENLRYIHFYPDNPLGLVILRGFTATLAHGTATALTGIALGSFMYSARDRRRMLPLLLGLSAAMTLHYLWNVASYRSPLSQSATEWALAGVGLSGLALVAAAILWGVRRERLQLRKALDMKVGVSVGEASSSTWRISIICSRRSSSVLARTSASTSRTCCISKHSSV
jgi:RsiW-degrading membrane proteinase PrsW (M82 family)